MRPAIRPLLAAAALVAVAGVAQPVKPAASVVVRGAIVAFTPASAPVVRDAVTTIGPAELAVKANDGATVTVLVPAAVRVAAVAKAGVDAIQPNGFIGTTTKRGRGGVLEAIEVHVFPETMRGTGEGHYPADRGATSTTTNGTVTQVGTIKHHAGRTLTVDYKGGSQQIVVPANVPVVAFAEGTPALLVPGAHVVAVTTRTPEGRLATDRVAVGVGGIVPPM